MKLWGVCSGVIHGLLHERHFHFTTNFLDVFPGWPAPDLEQLFDRMMLQVPPNDALTFDARFNRVDWEKVFISTLLIYFACSVGSFKSYCTFVLKGCDKVASTV